MPSDVNVSPIPQIQAHSSGVWWQQLNALHQAHVVTLARAVAQAVTGGTGDIAPVRPARPAADGGQTLGTSAAASTGAAGSAHGWPRWYQHAHDISVVSMPPPNGEQRAPHAATQLTSAPSAQGLHAASHGMRLQQFEPQQCINMLSARLEVTLGGAVALAVAALEPCFGSPPATVCTPTSAPGTPGAAVALTEASLLCLASLALGLVPDSTAKAPSAGAGPVVAAAAGGGGAGRSSANGAHGSSQPSWVLPFRVENPAPGDAAATGSAGRSSGCQARVTVGPPLYEDQELHR